MGEYQQGVESRERLLRTRWSMHTAEPQGKAKGSTQRTWQQGVAKIEESQALQIQKLSVYVMSR